MSPYFFIKRRKQPFNYWQNHLPNGKLFSLLLSFSFIGRRANTGRFLLWDRGLVCVLSGRLWWGLPNAFSQRRRFRLLRHPPPPVNDGAFFSPGRRPKEGTAQRPSTQPCRLCTSRPRGHVKTEDLPLVCGPANQPLQRCGSVHSVINQFHHQR